jgi:hypothetical protein
LNDIHGYFEDSYDDYMNRLISDYKMGVEGEMGGIVGDGMGNVTSNIIREFIPDSYLEFTPTLPECEQKIKSIFQKGLETTTLHEKLEVGDIKRSLDSFDFGELIPNIQSVVSLLDSFLSESFLSLIAVHFFLQSFEHLFIEDKKLLEDEIYHLEKNNNFEPMKDEIVALYKDLRYVERMQDTIYFGLFKIDIKELRTMMISKIKNAVNDCFLSTIRTKFENLLKTNREIFESLKQSLSLGIDTVENFMELKTFIESHDLKDQMESIQADIKLCKNINEFLEEFRFRSEALVVDYLLSLHWIRDLKFLQSDARRRLMESSPRFTQELKKQADAIFDRMLILQNEIQKFPSYYEIVHANLYYDKTLEINKQLRELLAEGAEINRKQSVLEVKETSFDSISHELQSFDKYAKLWEFVSYSWGPVVERWWKGSFTELSKFEMSSTLSYGADLLKNLIEEFSDNSKILEIVKNKMMDVERHQNIYSHVVILKDPSFKDRHWQAFFAEIKDKDKGSSMIFQNSRLDPKRITLSDLMEFHLTSHTNFLKQILTKARAEALVEQSIKETKDNVRKIPIKPRSFDTDNFGLSILPNTASLLTTMNEHKSICKNMLANPDYPDEFKRELAQLIRLISFTIEVIRHLHKVQNHLIKFSPLFKFSKLTTYIKKEDFVAGFLKIRQDFMEIMRGIIQKEMMYFLALIGEEAEGDAKVEDIIKRLKEMNRHCEDIMHELYIFFKALRKECPRYYFFSDQQMLTMCSLLKFPKSFLGIIMNLFKGIETVQFKGTFSDGVEVDNFTLVSFKTKNGEVIPLIPEIHIDLRSTSRLPMMSVIKEIEKAMDHYMISSREQHLAAFSKMDLSFSEIFHYSKQHGLIMQTIRLFMQIVFDYKLLVLYKAASRSKVDFCIQDHLIEMRNTITAKMAEFYDHPSRFIAKSLTSPAALQFFCNFIMIIKQFEDTLNYLINNQLFDFDCFEFQCLPKYSVEVANNSNSLPSPQALSALANQALNLAESKQFSIPASVNSLLSSKESILKLYVMEYGLTYQNEIQSSSYSVDYSPLYQKTSFLLVSSIINNRCVLFKGPASVGKNTMVRCLSYLAGRNHYEYDCAVSKRGGQISAFVIGTLTGGYWLTTKNLQVCSDQMLSLLSVLAETVKIALVGTPIKVGTIDVTPREGFCLFSTYRLTSIFADRHNFPQLPVSIRETFRIVSLATPQAVTIFSTLVSPVIPYPSSLEWSTKLLLFIRSHHSMEFYEKIDGDSSKSAESRVFELSMKIVCGVIKSSLEKYYAYIHRSYEKFRDQNGKFRLDIDKVKIISNEKDRRGIFTKIMIESLSEYFSRVEIGKEQLRGLVATLTDIFKDDLEPANHVQVSGSSLFSDKKLKEKVHEAVKDFNEFNWMTRIPSYTKLQAKLESFLSMIMASDEDGCNHFLVYGRPDSQKSTMIKLLAFIYSEIFQMNFRKFWLMLEAIKPEYVFGGDNYEGVLSEIFNQSHGLDLEEKSNQPKKINYLFQSGTELFYKLADARDQKKLKTPKDVHKSHSWIVFDGNTGKSNPQVYQTITSVISMFNTMFEYKEIDHHVGVSQNLKLFYELNTIAMLEPKIVADLKLMYLDASLVDLKERAEQWMDELKSKDSFFSKNQERILTVVHGLAIPYIEKLHLAGEDRAGVFIITSGPESMISNFFALCEIFLNEFRKYYIIHDFDTLKEQPSLISTYKIEANTNAGKGARTMHPFSSTVRLLQPRSSRHIGNSGQNIHHHYLSNIDSAQDIEDMVSRRIEAICLFTLVQTLFPLLYETRREAAGRMLEDSIHVFTKKTKVQKPQFACGAYTIQEQRKSGSLAEFCFDFTTGLWVKWSEVKPRIMGEISNNFSSRSFNRIELERLNCQNSKLLNVVDTIEDQPRPFEVIVGLKERSIVFTSETSMISYFLEYMTAYNRNLIVFSEPQQGKTLVIRSAIKKLIEQNRAISFYFQMQRGSDGVSMQKIIENGLQKEMGNVLRPARKKNAIVWVDDLHMSSSSMRVESLSRSLDLQGGWYSHQGKCFYKVLNTSFVFSASLREADPLSSQESANCINLDILTKSFVVKPRRLNEEELRTIFHETVVNQIVSTPTSSRKGEEGLTSSLFKNFSHVVLSNIESLRNHSNYRMLCLGFENFHSIAKTVNLLTWRDINKDQKEVQYAWLFLLHNFICMDHSMKAPTVKTLLSLMTKSGLTPSYNKLPSGLPSLNALPQIPGSVSPRRLRGVQMAGEWRNNMMRRGKGEETLHRGSFNLEADSPINDSPKSAFAGSSRLVANPSKFGNRKESADADQFANNSSKHLSPSKVGVSLIRSLRNVTIPLPKKNYEEAGPPTSRFANRESNNPDDNESKYSDDDEEKLSDHSSSDLSDDKKPQIQTKKSRFYQPAKEQPASTSPNDSPKIQPKDSISQLKPESNLQVRSKRSSVRPSSSYAGSESGSKVNPLLTVKNAKEINHEESLSESSSSDSAEYKYLNPDKTTKKAQLPLSKESEDVEDPSYGGMSPFDTSPKRKFNLKKNASLESDLESADDVSKISGSSDQDNDFKISKDKSIEFFWEMTNRVFNKGDHRNLSHVDRLRETVILNKRILFDIALTSNERKDEFDRDYDMYLPKFEFLEGKHAMHTSRYIKNTLQSYIFTHPEALFSLKLDPSSFSQLLNDFTTLHLSIRTEFQHMMISTVKSSLYVKNLLAFVCQCTGDGFHYFDLGQDEINLEKEHRHLSPESYNDTVTHMKLKIRDNFERIVRNNKRLVFLVYVNSVESKQSRDIFARVLDFATSIIFNTDLILEHFGEECIHEFITIIKKQRILTNSEDFFATYYLRNKLENKITFIFLHEAGQDEIIRKKIKQQSPEESSVLARFLVSQYPKIASRLRKLVFDGLKCNSIKEIHPVYDKILPFDLHQNNRVLNLSLSLELHYLKTFDKELSSFSSLRPLQENQLLFYQVRKQLDKKFPDKEDPNAESLVKEQRQLVANLNRWKEEMIVDLARITKDIENREKELDPLSRLRGEVENRKSEIASRRSELEKNLKKVETKLDLLRQEELKLQKDVGPLQETKEAMTTRNSKEFYTNLSFGAFLHSQTFTMYSILFHEYFSMYLEPKLTVGELQTMTVGGMSLAKYGNYATSLSRILEDPNPNTGFISYVKDISPPTLPDDRLRALYRAVTNTNAETIFIKFQPDQRLLLLWIDLIILSAAQSRYRPEIDESRRHFENAQEQLRLGLKDCDTMVEDLSDSLKKQSEMTKQMEMRLINQKERREAKKKSLEILDEFLLSLGEVQTLYAQTCSPFLAHNLDKPLTLDILTSYIVFWNKYPYQQKRVLFYHLLKAVDYDTSIIEQVPVSDFLCPVPLLLSLLTSNIPFNQNMINNISITQFMHEGMLPYAAIRDSSGLFIRYLQEKYSRFLHTDYFTPSDHTLEDIETCMTNGQPYMIVDPDPQLIRIVRPILEWRFRRFTENVLIMSEVPSAPPITGEVNFNLKRIMVREGFRIYIVLQKSSPDTIDPQLLAKLIILNNECSEEKIWNETLTEELLIYLESTQRNECIQKFLSTNITTLINEKYQEMAAKLASFNFLGDSLLSPEFKGILELLKDIKKLALEQSEAIQRNKLSSIKDKVMITQPKTTSEGEKDLEADSFMSAHLQAIIPEYTNLHSRHSALVDRLRVYYLANERFKAYIGDELSVSQELFVYIFKECVQAYQRELNMKNEDGQILPKADLSQEQLDAVFSKIERTFYNQLMNTIPHKLRYIYTFLVGLSHLLVHHPSGKRNTLKNLYLFLFSEKILPKQDRKVAFATPKLYDRFNKLFQGIKQHFIYSSSNMPEQVEINSDFDGRIKEAEALDELRLQFKLDLFQFEDMLYHPKDKDKALAFSAIIKNQTDSVGTKSVAGDSGFGQIEGVRSREFTSEWKEPTSQVNLQKSRAALPSEEGDDKIEDEVMRQIRNVEKMKQVKDQSPEADEFNSVGGGSSPFNTEKKNTLIKLQHVKRDLDKPRLSKQLSVEFFVDSYGNIRSDIDSPTKSISPPKMSFKKNPKILAIEKSELRLESGSEELASPLSRNNRNPSFEIESQPLVAESPSSKMERKPREALISATKTIILKNKQMRADIQKKFVEKFLLYLNKTMNVIIKTDDTLVSGSTQKEWQDFLTFGRSALIGDSSQHLLPKIPINEKAHHDLPLLNLFTIFKYSRPDLMRYLLESFYALLRGVGYSRVYLDLGLFANSEHFKKPIALIYGQTSRTPFLSLQRVGESMGLTLQLLRLDNHSRVDELMQVMDQLHVQKVWVVLENVELLSKNLAYNVVRSVTNYLLKPRANTKFKVWILYQAKKTNINQRLWPDWISSCYRIQFDTNKSVKEEMIGLYWREVYQLSSATRSQLAESTATKRRLSVLSRGRSLLWIPDASESMIQSSNDNDSNDNQESPKSPTSSSNAVSFYKLILDNNNHTTVSKSFLEEYKPRLVYCLKYFFALSRQRSLLVKELLGQRDASLENHKHDEEIEMIIEEMTKDMSEVFIEPYMYIFKYINFTVLNAYTFEGPFVSPLAFKTFLETYIVKSIAGVITLKIENETYVIPKQSSYTSFHKVFEEGILKLPTVDNPKIVGLQNNQEICANYSISKEAFKHLTNYFHDTKLEQLDDKILDKQQFSEFSQLLARKVGEGEEDPSIIGYLELASLVLDRYESTLGYAKDNSKILGNICTVLGPKYFDHMKASLFNLSATSTNELISPNKANKASGYSIKFVDNVEHASYRSAERERDNQAQHKKDDSLSYKSEGPNKAAGQFRAKFALTLLVHEYKSLKRIVDLIVRDLSLAKLYLTGEPVNLVKERAGSVLRDFYLNQIPDFWRPILLELNLSYENFSVMIRSVLVKFDQIYNLIVKLKGELPPIIPVNRLLDPQAFFINFLNTNCRLRNLSAIHCVFTLRSTSDKSYPHSQSTLKITGLTVKGGSLDPITGELVEENAREFDSGLGRLYLEVAEAEPIDPNMQDDGSVHMSFISLNKSRNNHTSLLYSYYRSMHKDTIRPSSLLQRKSLEKTPEDIQRDMRNRLKRQLTMDAQGEYNQGKHIVRIPVYFSPVSEISPLASIRFFLYAASTHPQMHWTNKATHVCLLDSN